MSEPVVKYLKTHLDDRGYLAEILRCDDPDFKGFGQLYISTINPGAIKGFHVHQRKTDYMTCVSGQVKLACIAPGDVYGSRPIEFHLNPMAPSLVIIPPGWWHGWMCIGSKEAILVNITTEAFNPLDKDEHRIPFDYFDNYKWGINNG